MRRRIPFPMWALPEKKRTHAMEKELPPIAVINDIAHMLPGMPSNNHGSGQRPPGILFPPETGGLSTSMFVYVCFRECHHESRKPPVCRGKMVLYRAIVHDSQTKTSASLLAHQHSPDPLVEWWAWGLHGRGVELGVEWANNCDLCLRPASMERHTPWPFQTPSWKFDTKSLLAQAQPSWQREFRFSHGVKKTGLCLCLLTHSVAPCHSAFHGIPLEPAFFFVQRSSGVVSRLVGAGLKAESLVKAWTLDPADCTGR